MYYQRKKKKGRIVALFSIMLTFVALTYGYISNQNKPIEKPSDIPEKDMIKNDDRILSQNTQNDEDAIDNIEKWEKNNQEALGENTSIQDPIDITNDETQIILNTLYKQTGEIQKSISKVPITLAGITLDEFKEYIEKNYSDWKIKNISTVAAELFKEKDGLAPGHYIMQNKDGYIVIYKINELGEKELFEETDISLSVLSEADKNKLNKGIILKSLDEVMNIIEDYSS